MISRINLSTLSRHYYHLTITTNNIPNHQSSSLAPCSRNVIPLNSIAKHFAFALNFFWITKQTTWIPHTLWRKSTVDFYFRKLASTVSNACAFFACLAFFSLLLSFLLFTKHTQVPRVLLRRNNYLVCLCCRLYFMGQPTCLQWERRWFSTENKIVSDGRVDTFYLNLFCETVKRCFCGLLRYLSEFLFLFW